jgi:cobaltochelatase CobN
MNELNEEFGLNVAFKIYYPNQINEAEVEEETVKNDLKESDIVLIDIRGGGRSSEIAYDALKDEKNIVLNLIAPLGKLMEITRLGSFAGGKIAARMKTAAKVEIEDPEELWKKIERVQKIVGTAGRFLPIKSIKDARNYMKAIRYWRY